MRLAIASILLLLAISTIEAKDLIEEVGPYKVSFSVSDDHLLSYNPHKGLKEYDHFEKTTIETETEKGVKYTSYRITSDPILKLVIDEAEKPVGSLNLTKIQEVQTIKILATGDYSSFDNSPTIIDSKNGIITHGDGRWGLSDVYLFAYSIDNKTAISGIISGGLDEQFIDTLHVERVS
jgi:hypothetical protein